jgi:crotonobetainyl-CoA:carnitine CoA-transferase CaiB-like acyl-CoA transferase
MDVTVQAMSGVMATTPALGEHTDDVLRTWLNLSDAAIERSGMLA